MSQPPLTSSQSHVFTGDKGKPWRFFVEATAVRGRPTLIRKITRNGGTIVNSAREADILLAENNTKEALELFEAWRGDKVLLSTRWIARCLEAQAFLGGDQGWSGYEFTRDLLLQGIISGDEASEAEEDESQKPKRPRRTASSSHASKTSPSKSLREPGPSRSRTTSNTTSPNQSRKLPSKTEHVVEQNPSNIYAKTHNYQLSANGSLNGAPNPSLSPNPTLPPNPALPIDTSLQAPLSSSQAALQQQQALLATMFNLMQPSQQPPSPDLLSSLGQYSNFPQIPPLFTPTLQQYFAQQLAVHPHALNSHPTELVEQPVLGITGQLMAGLGVPSSSTQETSTRPTPEDVDTDVVSDAASVRSEEGEVELSISRKRRGKERAMSDSSSEREVQTAVRSNPPRSKVTAPKKMSGIFVDGQGMPNQFYIMVDLKNRKDLLKIVRKHNGTIVSQMGDADYIILNNRSNQFQKALSLLPIHKTAISPTWLEECEKMGKMVEIASHIIDISSGIGRGASRRKTPAMARRNSILKECESEQDASERLSQPSVSTKALPIVEPQEASTTSPLSRSRSPLPPTNITPASEGRNLFTEEDRIWFLKYARFKLERDPEMTNVALMRAMAHKAPHHTTTSWTNMSRTKWANELKSLKQEIATLRVQTNPVSLPSPYSPTTSQGPHYELLYPENSPHATPVPSQSDVSLPPSTASTSFSPQAEFICTTPLKRKEQPSEEQVRMDAMNQQNKRPKTAQDNVIDVDSYPDIWLKPI